jgi:hypothetical protein
MQYLRSLRLLEVMNLDPRRELAHELLFERQRLSDERLRLGLIPLRLVRREAEFYEQVCSASLASSF